MSEKPELESMQESDAKKEETNENANDLTAPSDNSSQNTNEKSNENSKQSSAPNEKSSENATQQSSEKSNAIVSQPMSTNAFDVEKKPLKSRAVMVNCDKCGYDCLTRTQLKVNYIVSLSSLATCVCTCCCCVCCLASIPWLIEESYDIKHKCRHCGAYIGLYKRKC